VADRVAELALGAPAGLVPDIAGPEIIGMGDAIRDYLRAAGKRTWAAFLADQLG
jgi:hypothetical protein